MAQRDSDYHIERMLDAIRRKLVADADVIRKTKGPIRIRIAEKGTGFQLDLDLSI